MARPAGFEPATIRLEGGCSIQLSYGAHRLAVKPTRAQDSLPYKAQKKWSEWRDSNPRPSGPKQMRYQAALHSDVTH